MAFSMGLLDWLFGERIQMDFPDGQRRSVTKRWFQEMQRQGRIRPAPEKRKRIRVHLLNPACRTFPPILPLPEWIDPDIYTVAEWTIGQDVSAEIVRKWLDPGTNGTRLSMGGPLC